MSAILLHLEAPLMSFGGVSIDAYGPTMDFPSTSLLTGMMGNALGYRREDFEKLSQLQRRLRYVAILESPGEILEDYQTAYLGQDYMDASRVGWTTWGRRHLRGGAGPNKRGTDIRRREYLQDGAVKVLLAFVDADMSPSVAEVRHALEFPARPLFIGRKGCIPSRPIVEPELVDASDGLLTAAVSLVFRGDRSSVSDGERQQTLEGVRLVFPERAVDPQEWRYIEAVEEVLVSEGMDWSNRMHTGRSRCIRARIKDAERSSLG